MNFRRSAALVLALASLPLSAHAVQNIRPGLWEFRSTHLSLGGLPDMSSQMAQLQQKLKNLPPDTRRMIEQQMAQRGVSLGHDGSARSCITPEQARQDNIFSGKVEGNCTLTDVVKAGNPARTTVTRYVRVDDPSWAVTTLVNRLVPKARAAGTLLLPEVTGEPFTVTLALLSAKVGRREKKLTVLLTITV